MDAHSAAGSVPQAQAAGAPVVWTKEYRLLAGPPMARAPSEVDEIQALYKQLHSMFNGTDAVGTRDLKSLVSAAQNALQRDTACAPCTFDDIPYNSWRAWFGEETDVRLPWTMRTRNLYELINLNECCTGQPVCKEAAKES